MSREIKFRAWDGQKMIFVSQLDWDLEPYRYLDGFVAGARGWSKDKEITHYKDEDLSQFGDFKLLQFTGLTDKNGKEIYEGDVLEFSDKWEWYRSSYGVKMMFADKEEREKLQEQYDAEPMERREVQIPGCYEELSAGDLKNYWEVIGNIYENPELLTSKEV